jgi:hypothetical protein
MGLARKSPEEQPLVNKMVSLLHKAGYEIIFPDKMENLCCGTIWESKGMPDVADSKAAELETALLQASENGKYRYCATIAPVCIACVTPSSNSDCTSRPNSSILFCKTSWNSGQPTSPLPCTSPVP